MPESQSLWRVPNGWSPGHALALRGGAAEAQNSGRWLGRVAALASCTTKARIQLRSSYLTSQALAGFRSSEA